MIILPCARNGGELQYLNRSFHPIYYRAVVAFDSFVAGKTLFFLTPVIMQSKTLIEKVCLCSETKSGFLMQLRRRPFNQRYFDHFPQPDQTLGPQSRCGDKPVKFQVFCPQYGTAVLKGLTWVEKTEITPQSDSCIEKVRKPRRIFVRVLHAHRKQLNNIDLGFT